MGPTTVASSFFRSLFPDAWNPAASFRGRCSKDVVSLHGDVPFATFNCSHHLKHSGASSAAHPDQTKQAVTHTQWRCPRSNPRSPRKAISPSCPRSMCPRTRSCLQGSRTELAREGRDPSHPTTSTSTRARARALGLATRSSRKRNARIGTPREHTENAKITSCKRSRTP